MGLEVLVVDDDSAISHILSLILRKYGFQPITAPNGAVALEMLKHRLRPVLILTDFSMPILNGSEFVEALYREPELKNIPVFMITGSSPNDVSLPVTDNFKGVIAKPFHLQSILEIVFQTVDNDYNQSAFIS